MLWRLLFSLFDVQWVLHSSIKRNLIGWHGAFMSKRREKAQRAAPLCLMWTLWKERNERVFKDIKRSDQALKHSFLYTFVNWGRGYLEDLSLSFFVHDCFYRMAFIQLGERFFVFLFAQLLGRCLYTLCVLFLPLLSFANTNSYLPIKKKEKEK